MSGAGRGCRRPFSAENVDLAKMAASNAEMNERMWLRRYSSAAFLRRMLRFTMATILLVASLLPATASLDPAYAQAGTEKFYPDGFAAHVRAHPEEMIGAILLAAREDYRALQNLVTAHHARSKHSFFVLPLSSQPVPEHGFLSAVALILPAVALQELSQSDVVRAVWYVHKSLLPVYAKVMQGIGYGLQNGFAIINISLGSPAKLLPMEYRPEEPINQATRAAAEAGIVVVVSAGNFGPADDTLNPWCVAPWVICVGAATATGELAQFSSRGRPGDPVHRPTVVAPGVDVLAEHSPDLPKTRDQLEAEKRIGFTDRVPPDKRDAYTVVTGTSFAAANVTFIVTILRHFLRNARAELEQRRHLSADAPAMFSQIYDLPREGDLDDRVTGKRLVGTRKRAGQGSISFHPLEDSPAVVKQMLMDMALEVPGRTSHEVGAGFVHRALALYYFGRFGLPDSDSIPVLWIDDF